MLSLNKNRLLSLIIFHNALPSVYRWITDEWSACSKTCGGGIMERTVVCTEESNGIKNKVKLNLFHLKYNFKLSNFCVWCRIFSNRKVPNVIVTLQKSDAVWFILFYTFSCQTGPRRCLPKHKTIKCGTV